MFEIFSYLSVQEQKTLQVYIKLVNLKNLQVVNLKTSFEACVNSYRLEDKRFVKIDKAIFVMKNVIFELESQIEKGKSELRLMSTKKHRLMKVNRVRRRDKECHYLQK